MIGAPVGIEFRRFRHDLRIPASELHGQRALGIHVFRNLEHLLAHIAQDGSAGDHFGDHQTTTEFAYKTPEWLVRHPRHGGEENRALKSNWADLDGHSLSTRDLLLTN